MTGADIILLGHGSRGSATDEGLREATARLSAQVLPPARVRMAAWEFTRGPASGGQGRLPSAETWPWYGMV